MIRTEGLSYTYAGGSQISFTDIDSLDSEPLLILGGSGTGKTTLLHLLGGLMKPSHGKVWIGDKEVTKLSSRQLDQFRGKHIGIIFQQNHFIAALTVLDNLLLAQRLAGSTSDAALCQSLLDSLHIGHKAGNLPSALSQGERQRAAIARALVNKPTIILADEPTSALDDHNCQEVIRLLEEQALANHAKLVVVTHDNRLSQRYPQRIILSENQKRN